MLAMRGIIIRGGTRRELIKAAAKAVAGLAAGTLAQLHAGQAQTKQPLSPDQVEVRLELTQDELALEKSATDKGVEITSESRPVPREVSGLGEARFAQIVVVIAAATVAVLSKRLVDQWLKSQEHGVEIDAHTTPPTISTVSNVPQGFLVIIDKDGKVSHHKTEYDKSEDLVPLLAKLFSGA
jgi:hypothetical protein